MEDIQLGTRAALQLVRGLGVNRVAFPLLGAGVVGLKPVEVVRTMKGAMADYDDLHITVCVHWQGDWPAVQQAFDAA